MSSNLPRKAKVSLADYSYKGDIENRILMAQLSVFEVQVLQEIVNHSLKISIEPFARDLEIAPDQLLPIIDKLSATKLFKRQQMTLIVDKDYRKYYEFQLERFNDDFQPDLHFLQNILNHIPIHVLPLWYAIPRSSDNIISSIIEKYFSTPKVYRQYLNELQFDNPILHSIIEDVFIANHFKVKASDLMEKYALSRECFEEYLLLLEYHFACCLSYTQIENSWQEVVTPFFELHEYLLFEFKTLPRPIQGEVQRTHYSNFNFIHELQHCLQTYQKGQPKKGSTQSGQEHILQKLLQIKLIKKNEDNLYQITEKGKEWLPLPLFEKVTSLATDPLNILKDYHEFSKLWNIRNLHLIEKKLQKLKPNEWIAFDQFMESFIAPLGDKEPVTLKNKGKSWKYVLPTYNETEIKFIQAVIMERLGQLGIVETGLFQDKPCFCLTPFGSQFIQ